MQQKYFLLDKNYILKDVQASMEAQLILHLIRTSIDTYLFRSNPLGLEDDPIMKIRAYNPERIEDFQEFYHLLCGVYRYQIGTNQLEFLFDGKSHHEKYEDDWRSTFEKWVTAFCEHERFLKVVLSLTVFYEDEKSGLLAQSRLKYFVSQHFNIKVYRYKGIMSAKVA